MKRTKKRLIGNLVQLLDGFALHISLTGRTEDIDQASASQVMSDDFSDKSDLTQQAGKFTGRSRMLGLTADDKAA